MIPKPALTLLFCQLWDKKAGSLVYDLEGLDDGSHVSTRIRRRMDGRTWAEESRASASENIDSLFSLYKG